MKIAQNKPFEKETMMGSNNRLFAIVPLGTQGENENINFTAEAIEINRESEAKDAIKNYLLSNLTVIVGLNEFYADSSSRADITDAILEAKELDLADNHEKEWKCKNGIVTVTISDLKSARKLALEKKGEIVGIK